MRLPHFRFSIPSLIAITAVSAVTIWWLVAPSATAMRFSQTVNDARYPEAAQMFVRPAEGRMLSQWGPITAARASTLDLSWNDLLRGRRKVELSVTYDSLPGRFSVEVDSRGVHLVH